MDNRFYLARKKAHLTQYEVANILKIQHSAISKWECGRTVPDGRMLKQIAELYGVSSDFLLDISSKEPELFDDSRIPKTEIQQLYDNLTPAQQQNLLNYARGMAVSNGLEKYTNSKNNKMA